MSDSKPFDSVNLLPYLTGQKEGRPHEELFWRMIRRTALRVGDWKLLRNPRGGRSAEWELYDLADDIGEKTNLASQEPERFENLLAAWKRWNAQMEDPRWQRPLKRPQRDSDQRSRAVSRREQ